MNDDGRDLGTGVLPLPLVGVVVPLSPTTAQRWQRCRREYLLDDVLQLPGLEAEAPAAEGLKVHALLRYVHHHGSCHDRPWLSEVVDSYGGTDSERLRGFIERHARKCPQGATALGHELELARFHREPMPMFMAAARIDAVWEYDGVLDARDYKTGGPNIERVGDDLAARVQAFLLAPLAAERGLRLRLRYELLSPEADEDPDVFEPDAEQLAAIEEELRATVGDIRAERHFRGVSEPAVCGRCTFRSICVDSATRTPGAATPA